MWKRVAVHERLHDMRTRPRCLPVGLSDVWILPLWYAKSEEATSNPFHLACRQVCDVSHKKMLSAYQGSVKTSLQS